MWQSVKRSWHVGRVRARVARGGRLVWRVGRVSESDGAWQCVERVLVRQKLQAARGGAGEVFSGRSWLGFAQDCLFCHSIPLV